MTTEIDERVLERVVAFAARGLGADLAEQPWPEARVVVMVRRTRGQV